MRHGQLAALIREISLRLVGAESLVDVREIGEDGVEVALGDARIDHLDGDGHAHQQARLFHGGLRLRFRFGECVTSDWMKAKLESVAPLMRSTLALCAWIASLVRIGSA